MVHATQVRPKNRLNSQASNFAQTANPAGSKPDQGLGRMLRTSRMARIVQTVALSRAVRSRQGCGKTARIALPGSGDAYGKRAKQAASELVFGKQVTLQTYGLDKYGRTIADVLLLDGTNVNHELVKDGWCWWYRKYAPFDTTLEKLEKEAREAKKGLWVDPAPIPPWLYRKARRAQSLDMSDMVPLKSETKSRAPYRGTPA